MDQKKGKIGFTAGNFDLLHPGYIYTFETAKEHCDYFMVFLQRDPSELSECDGRSRGIT